MSGTFSNGGSLQFGSPAPQHAVASAQLRVGLMESELSSSSMVFVNESGVSCALSHETSPKSSENVSLARTEFSAKAHTSRTMTPGRHRGMTVDMLITSVC